MVQSLGAAWARLSRDRRWMLAIGLLAVVSLMFSGYEMSDESWGYWFFARILAETGRFNIFDRSPLYTVYVGLFRWLGYPHCAYAEHIVTYSLALAGFWYYFKSIMGERWAFFACLAWLPFLQITEHPFMHLAAASAGVAVALRSQQDSERRIVASYTFLFLAGLFRVTYFILIPAFLLIDAWKLWRSRRAAPLLRNALRPQWHFLPLLLLLVFCGLVKTRQSPHPANNTWFLDSRWFPVDGKNITESVVIQSVNWAYAEHAPDGPFEKDFYFTNRELFGDAKGLKGAWQANPGVILAHLKNNALGLVPLSLSITRLPGWFGGGLNNFGFASILVHVLIVLGAFWAVRRRIFDFIFVGANLFLVWVVILGHIQSVYLPPFVPLLVLAAWTYGRLPPRKYQTACLVFAIYALSSVPDWKFPLKGVLSWAQGNDVPLLQTRPDAQIGNNSFIKSMRTAYPHLEQWVPYCRKGFMAQENTFFGAFMDLPLENQYDVFSIPPQGRWGDGSYPDLNPEKIPCLFVSKDLATWFGFGTNHRLRFKNFIDPYINFLMKNGGEVHEVPSYGWVVFKR